MVWFAQFSYYKSANCTTPYGMVWCIITCNAVQLYHFAGGFGAMFVVCVVWWTPLIRSVHKPTKPNPPEGYPTTPELKSIQFGDCRSPHSKSNHSGSNDWFSLPKSNPPDSTNEPSQIQWRSTESNEISARSSEISTKSFPF